MSPVNTSSSRAPSEFLLPVCVHVLLPSSGSGNCGNRPPRGEVAASSPSPGALPQGSSSPVRGTGIQKDIPGRNKSWAL